MPAPSTFIADEAPATFVPDEPEPSPVIPPGPQLPQSPHDETPDAFVKGQAERKSQRLAQMEELRSARGFGSAAERLLGGAEWATRLVPFRGSVGHVALNTPDPYPIPSLPPLVEADALKAFAKEGLHHLHVPENIIPEPVKGAGEFLAETASGLTTPESILALSTGRPGARLFQADMIRHSGDVLNAAIDANKREGPLSAEAVKADLGALLSVAGPLGIEHGLSRPSGVPVLERTGKSLAVPEGSLPPILPNMQSARRIAEMTPDQFVKYAKGFNGTNLKLGNLVTPENVIELEKLSAQATERASAAEKKYAESGDSKDANDFMALSQMPQFFNEAIRVAKEKGQPNASSQPETTTVHGDLQPSPVPSEGQVSVDESRTGAQPQPGVSPPVETVAEVPAQEKVIAAALRDPETGEMWTDVSHPQAWSKVPSPANRKLTSGFLTNEGRYVTQDEASKISGKKNATSQKLFGNFMSPEEKSAINAKADELNPKPVAASDASPNQVVPPVRAVEKVKAQVQKVAAAGGSRDAKDIKAELVRRLEDAVTDAPETYDVAKGTKLTFNIPGDGELTVANEKKSLQELLDKARRISTTSGTAPKAPRSRAIGDFGTQVQAAIKAYGSAENAYRSAKRQRDTLQSQEPPSDSAGREEWNKQIQGAQTMMDQIYHQTKGGVLEEKASQARDRVATYREGAKGFETEIARVEAIKRKTQAHKELLADLNKRYAENQEFIKNNERDATKWEQEAAKEKAALDGDTSHVAPTTSTAKGLASTVRNKWTTATESPLGSEAGFFTLQPLKEIWDKYTPSVKAAIAHVKGVAREQMTLGKTGDYRRSILNWSAKLQRSFGEAAAAQKEIQDKISDSIRRDSVTNWIQAGGDATVLADRLAKTIAWRDPVTGKPHLQAKQLIKGYEAALHLTPGELSIASDAKAALDTLHTRGTTYDVLKSFKDNYVTQIWNLKRSPTGGNAARTLKDKFRFSKARTFDSYFDGEQSGFVPKTKDISKLLPVYLHEMNSVIAARQLVEQMSKGKATDGRPLLAAKGRGVEINNPSGKASLILPDAIKEDFHDYKTLENQPALHDWRWETKDSAGNPVFMRADLAVHPEAYAKLKNVLGKSAVKEWYDSKTSLSSAIPKLLVKGLDLAQQETKRTMLGLLTPFHQVQEGTHAVGHRVNPFFNNPVIDLVNNKAQMDAARHGLMLLPDRTSAEQFMEGFKQSKIVSAIPGLGPLADHYSNYLFHQYIPGIKFKTYEAILGRNLKVFEKDLDSNKVTPEDVKILSAEQANAAYGHLNYADLARNPTILHIMRLGLLAPDFLEARFRFSGQAIKGITGGKVGREQVIALATLAVAQASLSYMMAKTTGGQWDAKDPFTFHIGNRKFTMRSVPEDSVRLMADTRAFVYSRLNPIIGRGAVEYLSGTDWRGQKIKAGETTKQLLQQPIPLALRPLFGTDNSPLSGWEQLAGAAGIKITRYSAQSEIRKKAHEWMAKSLDPKIKAAEDRYEKESLPDSDYKPLREALINKDFKSARGAYKKLVETRKPELVQRQFDNPRPFSGSSEREQSFIRSLSAEDKVLYNQAKKEQEQLRVRFQTLMHRPAYLDR